MKALERATDSQNNQSALKRSKLLISPRIFAPVALMNSHTLNVMYDSSMLPEGEPSTGGDSHLVDNNEEPEEILQEIKCH
jgi:hypothetical protein